ncbi:ATP-binding protein [Streptomyces sp. MS06]|uniref:ATP-binding protein n=1 Tax=Streptomyces sp. MS06 TaxID=3385974 RepID=UPI0039A00AC2
MRAPQHRTDIPAEPPATVRPAAWRPADVRRAVRRAVHRRCRETGSACDEEALSDALLVASELTSNAILHGGGVTDVRIGMEERTVRVSVCDRSDLPPVEAPPVDSAGRRRAGGRGWPIVRHLSRDVRVAALPAGGKCVTARVHVF